LIRLPARFLNQPLSDDPTARLTSERLGALVRAYNQTRGWTADGYPAAEQIAELVPSGSTTAAE